MRLRVWGTGCMLEHLGVFVQQRQRHALAKEGLCHVVADELEPRVAHEVRNACSTENIEGDFGLRVDGQLWGSTLRCPKTTEAVSNPPRPKTRAPRSEASSLSEWR